MSKAKGVFVIGLVGAAVLGAVLLRSKSASAATPDDAPELTPTDTPEEVYAKAMDPRQTDAEMVQNAAQWLVSSGQRPDLAAIVDQKAQALRAEDILAEAVAPDVVATSAQLKAWAIALQPIPAYLEVVQKRAMAQQGQPVVPPSQTVTLLSGTGSLMVNYNAYLPTAAAASAPSPVVVKPSAQAPQVAVPRPPTPVLPDPKPKAKPKAKPQPQPATPAPIPMPATPAVSPSVTPISEQETEAEADPNGTIALARALLAEEQRDDWKRVSAAVESWQRTVGLSKPDGKFGPGSALRMAREVGVMPLVRYWSTGGKTLAQQLQAYRVGLYDEARIKKTAGNPTHAAALVSSAARENGQGWPKSGSDTSSVPFDFPSTAQLEQVEQNIDSLLNRGPTK